MSCSSAKTSSSIYVFSSSKKSNFETLIPHQRISFTSQLSSSKSKISIKCPSGSSRARSATRVKAFYAPTEQSTESLYELLGITENESTLSDIKKAYKQMARKYHPDVSPPDRVDEYTRRFIMVKRAYETLSNPNSKALYDQDLDNGFGDYYSTRRHYDYQYEQRMDETRDWKVRWQSQLDELKTNRNGNCMNSSRISWGARMRRSRR